MLSTEAVSERDGFEWWSHMVAEAVMPVSIRSDHTDRFRGTVTALDLTATQVSAFAFSPMSAHRSAIQVRKADPEDYFLFMTHGSPITLEQCRNSAVLRAGDMALFDSSHPLAVDFHDHGRLARVTLMRLPRRSLPLPSDKTDRLLGTRMPPHVGVGGLLSAYLSDLRANAERCGSEELRRMGRVGVDLATTFLAGRLTSPPPLSAESRRNVLLARIDAFIEHHLGEPDLSPALIAARHHISVRSLHKLFQQEPDTVTAMIRRRRLERCRDDLADRRLRSRPIAALAARWGFLVPAEFSRAFRKAYGMTPREFRREVARQPASALGDR